MFVILIVMIEKKVGGISMMGKHHIITNISLLVSAVSIVGACCSVSPSGSDIGTGYGYIGVLNRICLWLFQPVLRVTDGNGIHLSLIFGLGYVSFLSLLFLFGTLLPDIDNKKSMLGRHMYLPLKHRTWTHTLWFAMLWLAFRYVLLMFSSYLEIHCICLWIVPVFQWFAVGCVFVFLGYTGHLWMDTYSAQGVCWFYPFQTYKEYASGAVVKPKHKWKLYYTNKPSETWLVCFVVVLTCVCVWFFGFRQQGYVRIWNILSEWL